jgi:hypothetical protein
MKVISTSTKNGVKKMFDTNSLPITETKWVDNDWALLFGNDSGTFFYLGTKSKVREMFDATVAAEKRGDKFFEIEY